MDAAEAMEITPHTPSAEELLRHSAWVQALALRLVRDAGTADDLVQDTWLAALKHGPTGDEKLRPWLSRVLRNFSRMRTRSERAREQRERRVATPHDSWPSAGELVERLETQRELVDALLALEEPLRATLILRFCEDKSAAEIARRTGVPQATVRWRVMRGLERLREKLDARHGGERRAWCLLLAPLALRAPVASVGCSSITKALAMQTSSKLTITVAAALLLLGFIAWQIAPDSDRRVLDAGNGTEARLDTHHSASGHEPRSEELTATTTRVRAGDVRGTGASIDPLGARLMAMIVDEKRQPLPNARLHAEGWPGTPAADGDEHGRIELRLPPLPSTDVASSSTWIDVVASHPGRASLRIGLHVQLGESTQLGEIRLALGGKVSGRVVDSSGAPLSGIDVLVQVLDGMSHGFVDVDSSSASYGSALLHRVQAEVPRSKTRDDGSFSIDGIDLRFVRVWALHPSYRAAWSDPLEASADRTAHCPDLRLVALDPARSIRGRVLAPDGTGAAFAHVFEPGFDERSGHWKEARADERGAFCIVPEHDGQVCTLIARDAADQFCEVQARDVLRGTQGLELRLCEWRKIRVIARLENGEPVCNYGVTTLAGTPAWHHSEIDVFSSAAHESGEFDVRVPAQTCWIAIYGSGLALKDVGPFDPEHLPESVEVVLERQPGVSGHVLRDGHPVAGASVSMLIQLEPSLTKTIDEVRASPRPLLSRTMGRNSLQQTRTDAAGRFFVGLIPERIGLLRIEARGSAPWLRWDVREPMLDLEVPLDDGGAIEGEVLVSDDVARAGILVGASCADGFVLYRRTDETGHYRFALLAAGDWQVRLLEREQTPRQERATIMNWGQDHGLVGPECKVATGETCHLDLDARGGMRSTLRGQLLIDGRSPGPWFASLRNEDSPIPLSRSSQLAPDGCFAIDVPQSGRWRLSIGGRFTEGNACEINDILEMGLGVTKWSMEFETAVIEGRASCGQPLKDTEAPVRLARLRRSETLSIDASLNIESGDVLRPTRVAAGTNELGYSPRPNAWEVWRIRSLEIRPGTTAEVDLR